MVALEPNRADRLFIFPKRGAGWAGQLDVLVNDLTVVHDFNESGIGDLLAVGVKTRRAEGDIERLPLAGRLADIDARGVAFNILVVDPARVNATAFNARISVPLDTKAVIDLNLVAAHQIDPQS